MKSAHILKSVSMIFCVLLCMTSLQAAAQAVEGGALLVAPHRLIIAPHEKLGTINVSNKSDMEQHYDMTLIDQVMMGDGDTVSEESFEYSLKDIVKFSPRHFSLPAGGVQTIRVLVNRPKGLEDGDYHSHLFLNKRAAHEPVVNMDDFSGIAVPVIVQHGKVSGEVNITGARLSRNAGKDILILELTHSGNSETSIKFGADYVQEGKPPVTVLAPQWFLVYREARKVIREYPLTGLPAGQGGTIRVYRLQGEDDKEKSVQKEIPLN